MADETIRSLIAKLGYDVDTTGAKRFEKSFDDLTTSVKDGAKDLKGVDFSAFLKNYNKQIKDGLKPLKSSLKLQFLSLGKDMAKFAADSVKKIFTSFATVEQARGTLEFNVGSEGLEKVNTALNSLPESIKNVTSELNVLKALIPAVDQVSDLSFFTNNLETIIKLSKVSGKSIEESIGIFSDFIQTGSNLDDLAKFNIISPEELKQFRQTGSGAQLGKASQEFRQQFLVERQGRMQEKTTMFFQKWSTTSTATLDKFDAAGTKLTNTIGEVITPSLNGLADVFLDATDFIKDSVGLKDSNLVTSGGNNVSNKSNNVVNNNITVNANNAGNPQEVAEEVRKVMRTEATKIIKNSTATTVPQGLNTNVIPNL